jgi:hypothetical protein
LTITTPDEDAVNTREREAAMDAAKMDRMG